MPNAPKNRLIISAAGSGKTTYVVGQALASKDKRVLITTYTQANKDEIVTKIADLKGIIPSNIDVETWFSFLLRHGVRPYQGSMTKDKIKGLLFVNTLSVIGIPESETSRYYFHDRRIYSDKLAKFVVRSDDASEGSVMSRLSRIYDNIYVDEVQDMSGYDLEVILKLFGGTAEITLVGDPRQVTYTTHPDNKYKQYKKGGIVKFVADKCPTVCNVDLTTLSSSHRNHANICAFSSLIYPDYPATAPCTCISCRADVPEHAGVFLLSTDKVNGYVKLINPTILRYNKAVYPDWNFGQSKGKTFSDVLVYPTSDFEKYLIDGTLTKDVRKKGQQVTIDRFDRSKLYVASTRARYSLGIVCTDKTLGQMTNERLAKLCAKLYR